MENQNKRESKLNVLWMLGLVAYMSLNAAIGEYRNYKQGQELGQSQGYVQGMERAELITQEQQRLSEKPSRLRELTGL